MKTTIKLLLAAVLFAGMAACTGNYEEINKNPYETDNDEMNRDGYILISSLITLENNVLPTSINRLQRTDCLLGGAWGRYMAESKASSWPNKFSTFDPPADFSDVLFNEVIPSVYPALTLLRTATENPVPLAIGDILKVMAMHRVTDAYGPIPYSKIGVNAELQVPYDSQRDVYMRMFDELDAAIEALTGRVGETINPNADQIFHGELTKWVRLANSVKLRLAMRIVYAEPKIAQQKAEEAVNHSIGVMQGNADNASLRTFGPEGNPMSVVVKYNAGDHRSIADMTVYMNSYSDPRRAAYFMPSGFSETYCGFRSGVILGGVDQFQNYSIFRMDKNTPLQWMNVAEVMFLQAEGAMRGWNMGGGTAESFYKRGIELSFEQWGVLGASTYLNNQTQPGTYRDPKNTYTYNQQVSTVTVKWTDSDDNERKLERIITQKWLANFPLGLEAWADMRRTGYPKVLPVFVNNSKILSASDTPRRCPYPTNEAISNTGNYNAALGLLGGDDNIATRVWWDCKK